MSDSKLEEASRCPKCANPGREVRAIPSREKGVIHVYLCENSLCMWSGTTWIVQVLPDGTIPDRKRGSKEFPKLPEGLAAVSEAEFEALQREGLV